MSPALQHIQTSPTPPACADVVVIGGGIIGVFTAYYLARRGVSVDEAEISRWASWRDFAKTAGVTTHMPEKAAPAVAAALVRLGRSVHQNCAAHGIEMEGGRVSGVITEAGVIKTKTAVLAGGAWASSFCRQLGIRFPQASIRQSILSVSPVAHRLPDALVSANVSATRRNDGRYALAISGRARVDVTPQFMRFAPQFVPMFAKRWRNLRPGSLEGIRGGHETLARWRLDAPTPMERVRILDPKADLPTIRETHRRPGFILAAGFSGHGFGIGAGAGHLIADLAVGAEPIVDPLPYRPGRFSDSAWGKVADF